MSVVTTVIVMTAFTTDDAKRALMEGYRDEAGRPVHFADLADYTPDEPCARWDHWMGTKGPEAEVWGGAFNHLDETRMLGWLRGLRWYEPAVVVWSCNGETLNVERIDGEIAQWDGGNRTTF